MVQLHDHALVERGRLAQGGLLLKEVLLRRGLDLLDVDGFGGRKDGLEPPLLILSGVFFGSERQGLERGQSGPLPGDHGRGHGQSVFIGQGHVAELPAQISLALLLQLLALGEGAVVILELRKILLKMFKVTLIKEQKIF